VRTVILSDVERVNGNVTCCVQELYQAGEKKLGTDESKFNQILCSQSYEQLRQVFHEYKNIAHKELKQSIRSEMSGDLESGMLTVGRTIQSECETGSLVCQAWTQYI